jgi:hypothetical protein
MSGYAIGSHILRPSKSARRLSPLAGLGAICRVELRVHDYGACCPCCGDSYVVATIAEMSSVARLAATIANIGKLWGAGSEALGVDQSSHADSTVLGDRGGPQQGNLELEATPRIELGMEVLQTSALPLGYVAAQGSIGLTSLPSA